jgi:hypothetical protein
VRPQNLQAIPQRWRGYRTWLLGLFVQLGLGLLETEAGFWGILSVANLQYAACMIYYLLSEGKVLGLHPLVCLGVHGHDKET